MFRHTLHRRLHREPNQPLPDASNDLRNRELALRVVRLTELDHESDTEDVEAGADDDQGLEMTGVPHQHTGENGSEDRGERVEAGDPRRRYGALIRSDRYCPRNQLYTSWEGGGDLRKVKK